MRKTATRSEDEADGEKSPTGAFLLTALAAGLFFSWWMSFHEIACGCISIRMDVPLPYTYISCHAYALGSMVAAALLLAFRARCPRLFSPRAIIVLCLVGAALTGIFSFYLLGNVYPVAALSQFLLNGVAALILVIGLTHLAARPLSQLFRIFLAAGLCYVAIDNLVFPLALSLENGFILIAPLQIALIAGCGLAVHGLRRRPSSTAREGGQQVAAAFASFSVTRWVTGRIGAREVGGADDGHLRFAWPLVFHLCIYGLIFGAMHVEASSLIDQYFTRSVPYSIGAAAAVALFYLCFLRRGARSSLWTKMRNVVFPLTMTAFLLLPFLDSFESYLPVAFINCAITFYLLLLFLGTFKVARESRLPYPAVACAGLIAYQGAFLVGSVLCQGQINVLDRDILQTASASIAAFLLLMAATIWVGSDRQARRLWGMRVSLPPKKLALTELHAKCVIVAQRYRLTPRESEILELLAQGKKIGQIAEELTISVYTARTHSKNMYAKLGVHAQTEAVELLNDVSRADMPALGADSPL